MTWKSLGHTTGTNLGLETYTCDSQLDNHRFIGAGRVSSHYMNPCWVLTSVSPPNNTLQGIFNQTIRLLCQEIAFENVVMKMHFVQVSTLQWRHNDHGGVSNHQPHGCLLNRLFRRGSKKASKLRVTGLCDRWILRTKTSYAENVSIWWRHHDVLMPDRAIYMPPGANSSCGLVGLANVS